MYVYAYIHTHNCICIYIYICIIIRDIATYEGFHNVVIWFNTLDEVIDFRTVFSD